MLAWCYIMIDSSKYVMLLGCSVYTCDSVTTLTGETHRQKQFGKCNGHAVCNCFLTVLPLFVYLCM